MVIVMRVHQEGQTKVPADGEGVCKLEEAKVGMGTVVGIDVGESVGTNEGAGVGRGGAVPITGQVVLSGINVAPWIVPVPTWRTNENWMSIG